MDEQRSYTEQEIANIIRRAAELQTKQVETPAKGFGASDLKRMAEDLGIDPTYVEQAMIEGSTPSKSGWGLVANTERVYTGEPDFTAIGEKATLAGQWGRHSQQVGNVFVTSFTRGLGTYNLTVRKMPGQTRMAVKSYVVLPTIFGCLTAFYGFMISMAILDSSKLINAGMVAAGIVFWIGLAALAVRRSAKGIHARASDILNDYSEVVQPVQSEPTVVVPKAVVEDLPQRLQANQ